MSDNFTTPCCGIFGSINAIGYNPDNETIECHRCGEVFTMTSRKAAPDRPIIQAQVDCTETQDVVTVALTVREADEIARALLTHSSLKHVVAVLNATITLRRRDKRLGGY